MQALQRTAFVIGFFVASLSLAHAGGRSALETYPILATKTDKPVADNATPAQPPAAASPAVRSPAKSGPDAQSTRRGRRTRLAHAGKAVQSASVEPPVVVVRPAGSSQAADNRPAAGVPAGDHAGLSKGQEAAAKTPGESAAHTELPVEAPAPTLAALIAKHAQENGIPVRLAQAVVRIESRGNSRASHGGALGLMQIKAGTARAAGFSGSASGLLDAETNLHFGMKVLADAFRDAGGDVCRTLMKYQSGHLATHMTRANRTYCSKARAVMAGA